MKLVNFICIITLFVNVLPSGADSSDVRGQTRQLTYQKRLPSSSRHGPPSPTLRQHRPQRRRFTPSSLKPADPEYLGGSAAPVSQLTAGGRRRRPGNAASSRRRPDSIRRRVEESSGASQPGSSYPSANTLSTPPQSLEGWLSHPTEAPPAPKTLSTEGGKAPSETKKSGVCGKAVSFGIQCKGRMDQCINDSHCPGTTRCCMVGDCGNLCVMPKGPVNDPKRKWLGASNVLNRQKEAHRSRVEASTTAFGLKIDDIAAGGKGGE